MCTGEPQKAFWVNRDGKPDGTGTQGCVGEGSGFGGHGRGSSKVLYSSRPKVKSLVIVVGGSVA